LEDQNLTFSLSPSLLRPLAKNLQKQKSVASVEVKEIKAQKKKKGFYIACDEAATIFYQNLSIMKRVAVFWPLLRLS
jgi:hypothetical protein